MIATVCFFAGAVVGAGAVGIVFGARRNTVYDPLFTRGSEEATSAAYDEPVTSERGKWIR